MISQIDRRLRAFRMAKVPALDRVDFDTALDRVASADRAVRDGIAGSSLLIAEQACTRPGNRPSQELGAR